MTTTRNRPGIAPQTAHERALFNGDRAWIIGNTGIGEATAYALARRSSIKTIMTGRDVDVRDGSAVDAFVRHNRPDHVVYCAGIHGLSMIGSISYRQALDILDVNVMGFVRVLDALVRLGCGRNVVAVTSDAARVPMRGSIAYCASKAALAQAVRVAARELAPERRINAVAPGIVADTPMTDYIDRTVPAFRGWTPERARAYEASQIPMGRRATKSEIATTIDAVLFVLPWQMTGATIDVTGGK